MSWRRTIAASRWPSWAKPDADGWKGHHETPTVRTRTASPMCWHRMVQDGVLAKQGTRYVPGPDYARYLKTPDTVPA